MGALRDQMSRAGKQGGGAVAMALAVLVALATGCVSELPAGHDRPTAADGGPEDAVADPQEFLVPADNAWHSTGIVLQVRDVLRISAMGTITVDRSAYHFRNAQGQTFTPAGSVGTVHENKPNLSGWLYSNALLPCVEGSEFMGPSSYSLVARVVPVIPDAQVCGERFLVGAFHDSGGHSGRLELGVNTWTAMSVSPSLMNMLGPGKDQPDICSGSFGVQVSVK